MPFAGRNNPKKSIAVEKISTPNTDAAIIIPSQS
jgi:hypothetical protein